MVVHLCVKNVNMFGNQCLRYDSTSSCYVDFFFF
jgi:hypothetical protein